MKERIIEVAILEIKQCGLKFSIRDLASRVGISTKTVYQYFNSKEDIISLIVDQSICEMKEKEQKFLNDQTLSIEAKLKQALILLPSYSFILDIRLMHELKLRYPNQWRVIDEFINQGWDVFRLLASEGIERGVFRQFDMELFIQVYIGALYRLTDYQVSVQRGVSLEKALGDMTELLIEGIGVKKYS
ncbi:hypothetical protein PAECIP111893_02904 [Paenibacillus plantiphilus]|uniref:HTH tetR-type domain-containing protein n=1 Tax=Paenibacillus plantiphilus TaxID=2905650 RepID=A0ABN8GGQ6_9BACL|nr:TetR/AcrR family transcriptional regulator [Paenibacillus plantiphilus]CAH1208804.1 hypothetical protein PAECIP111893_02904 [Paenibacillus plantiphilus]